MNYFPYSNYQSIPNLTMSIIDSIMSIYLWYIKLYQLTSHFRRLCQFSILNLLILSHCPTLYVRSFNVKYTLDSNSLTHGIKRKHHNIHIIKTRSKHKGWTCMCEWCSTSKTCIGQSYNLHKTTYVIDPNLKVWTCWDNGHKLA